MPFEVYRPTGCTTALTPYNFERIDHLPREPTTSRECSTSDRENISSSLPVTDLFGPLALAKNQIHMLGARIAGSSASLKLTKAPCNQRRQCLPSDLSL